MSRLLERGPRLVEILSRSERMMYCGAAFALILTVGMIFAPAVISDVQALIDTSLTAASLSLSLPHTSIIGWPCGLL